MSSSSGPCSYPAAQVDAMLEDRDRLWCLSLISARPALGTTLIQSVLEKYHDLSARQEEVLKALKSMTEKKP